MRACGLRRLQFGEIVGEAVKAFFPEAAIAVEPVVDALQRFRFELARAPLRLAPAADEAGVFKDFEVL
ncbi:MAG: hypothetical protein R3C55_00780 [Parvularculaceae bacterium]